MDPLGGMKKARSMGQVPSTEDLLKAIENMDALSEESKQQLRENLLAKSQFADKAKELFPTENVGVIWENLVLISLIALVTLVFVFFGYKLYKSLMDRQKRKEEKRRQKQQKKKK